VVQQHAAKFLPQKVVHKEEEEDDEIPLLEASSDQAVSSTKRLP